jgi:hypothetical protein
VSDTDVNLSKIEEVIAAARARKAARDGEVLEVPKPKITPEERSERKKQMNEEREQRKQSKVQKNKDKAVHMAKIDKAAAKLPPLVGMAETTFTEIIANFSAAQVAAIALHLQHYNRLKSTELAVKSKVETGMSVKIRGGNPRFIGCVGTVVEARRIRCFVDVPGVRKPVYCFTSDVEPFVDIVATGTDG